MSVVAQAKLAATMLGCFGRCYVAVKVLSVAVTTFLCPCEEVLRGCYGVLTDVFCVVSFSFT